MFVTLKGLNNLDRVDVTMTYFTNLQTSEVPLTSKELYTCALSAYPKDQLYHISGSLDKKTFL